MLREYTVLLDPPVFGQQGVAPITPGVTAPRQSSPESRARVPAPATRREIGDQLITSTHVRGKQEGDIAGGEYGMTGAGDTLWKIAMKVRPEKSISVQQTMMALQRLNPEAFINNNINLLKAGYVLKIPTRSEILSDTVSEAIAKVRVQNQAFQDYKGNRVSQLDATRRSSRSDSSGSSGDSGELKLLASDGSSGQRAGDSDARSEALENDLAVAREDLDRARRSNAELNVRMKDLSEQIETMNGIVKLQDDQLAALRAQIQKSLEATPKTTPENKTVTTTVTTARQESTAQLGSLLSNPFVLGGLALLLVGGLVGGMIFMRRRQEASAFENDDFAEVVLGDSQPELYDAEENEEFDEELLEEEEEELSPQTGDVISEVEIYIAYGRFPQAIKFLLNAIENEPDRADIQLKLLEVYAQTDDATAFNQQFEQLKLLGDSESTALAEELQSKIPGAAEAAVDQVATDSYDADESDDELSFDLDDLDSETDDDSLDLGDEGELDLELDLDADLDLDLDDDSLDLEDDGLELDLDDDGLDLDLEDDSIELDLDDDSLDLDLEDDGIELDLEDDGIELDLDDDSLDLEDDGIELDLEDDGIELDLEDDSSALDLDDDSLDIDLGDDSFELDLDDDGLELDLGDLDDLDMEEDASTKLDLARAYLDMGDNDGVRSLLEEVISEGSETDIKEANELMEKLD
jgi:pilus assembly protein FimV